MKRPPSRPPAAPSLTSRPKPDLKGLGPDGTAYKKPPPLSPRSISNLSEVDPRLRALFYAVAEVIPIEVICGHRGKVDQDIAFRNRRSKLPWPKSKHNRKPSLAVDVCPSPIVWSDLEAFRRLAKAVKVVALDMGIKIRHGADWDGDGRQGEPGEFDWPHFELVEGA